MNNMNVCYLMHKYFNFSTRYCLYKNNGQKSFPHTHLYKKSIDFSEFFEFSTYIHIFLKWKNSEKKSVNFTTVEMVNMKKFSTFYPLL